MAEEKTKPGQGDLICVPLHAKRKSADFHFLEKINIKERQEEKKSRGP